MSEAYDYLYGKRGSYVLCFDVQHLMEINRISHKAGDLAILEAALRLDQAATEDMLVMRIGGDEFALLTGLYDISEVKAFSELIIQKNGQTIFSDGKEVVVSLWCGITKIPETLRYGEFFTSMHKSICESKT